MSDRQPWLHMPYQQFNNIMAKWTNQFSRTKVITLDSHHLIHLYQRFKIYTQTVVYISYYKKYIILK